jgi:hypothetical protein
MLYVTLGLLALLLACFNAEIREGWSALLLLLVCLGELA